MNEDDYKFDKRPKFKLLVWNMVHLANKIIKLTKQKQP